MGDKTAQIKTALQKLEHLPGSRLAAVSPLYKTQPLGRTDQDWFVNAAALIETALSPSELLKALLGIESGMGRVRIEKWGPRLIDLDLLFFGQQIIKEPDLETPHPRLDKRRFVLKPLSDVAPDWVHPVIGLTPGELLARLAEDGQEVVRL